MALSWISVELDPVDLPDNDWRVGDSIVGWMAWGAGILTGPQHVVLIASDVQNRDAYSQSKHTLTKRKSSEGSWQRCVERGFYGKSLVNLTEDGRSREGKGFFSFYFADEVGMAVYQIKERWGAKMASRLGSQIMPSISLGLDGP